MTCGSERPTCQLSRALEDAKDFRPARGCRQSQSCSIRSMALAGGLLARSHGARDSGASSHFCARSDCVARAINDSVFLPRWDTRIPCVDDARVVARLCDRVIAVLRIDKTPVVALLSHSSRNRSINPLGSWLKTPGEPVSDRPTPGVCTAEMLTSRAAIRGLR